MTLSLLTATAFSYNSDALTQASTLHGISWIAQFLGHGLAEKRAPALLDNLLGGKPLAVNLFVLRLFLVFSCRSSPLLCSP